MGRRNAFAGGSGLAKAVGVTGLEFTAGILEKAKKRKKAPKKSMFASAKAHPKAQG
jgi:hypothetical protein